MSNHFQKSVLIVQEHLPAFRIGFYQMLRERLKEEGINLELVYAPNQRNNFVVGNLEWATPVPIRWINKRLGWQPVLSLCRDKDLVIIQQETKYLVNPALQLWSRFGGPKIAYWGHGRNFQAASSDSLEERLKKWLSLRVDWWFAYNELSARVVRGLGFPADRITSVDNAIDTTGLTERRKNVTDDELAAIQTQLGLKSENIAVYTGGLYPNKRIPFLLEAVQAIRRQLPDFELIVIGDGPDRHLIREAASLLPWIHDIGPLGDQDKVPYWALSKLLLMPGGVGLVLLDSFVLGVPMVTTDTRLHGPEISYLNSGANGLLVPCGDDSELYCEAVCKLMLDPQRLDVLREGAVASAGEYSIERMVDHFTNGVIAALAAPRV